jgi:serine-type D-Ala-D-Ala carboxypeptidase/endopeptidase (penicillin-binding protein 4)
VKSQSRLRRTLLFLFSFAVLLGSCLPGGAQQKPPSSLHGRIEAILDRSDARRGLWGIVVASLPDGKVLYSWNADHLFAPASNMKLFTTAAALERLGPEFEFQTTVESDAQPDAEGIVQDLILVGRGDPNISNRVLPYQYNSQSDDPPDKVLRELADKTAARGIREVRGDIVVDDRYFVYEPFGGHWSVEDLQWGYGAPVTALAFNDNLLRLHVLPGTKDGDPATVLLDPIADGLEINNRVLTSAARTTKEIFAQRLPGSAILDVWGEIPAGSPEDDDSVAIPDPPRLAAELFKRDLEALGITIRGQVRVLELPRFQAANMEDSLARDPGRVVLAEHVSLPLRDAIKVVNKVSQNLHAEMLLRVIGRETANYGSVTVGLRVLKEFAGEAGIEPEEFYFTDGSGLSRLNLVTPSAIVKLLAFMARSPHFEDYFDSLPIAGVDGTLGTRFVRSSAAGKIHAKTGSLGHVNALSGYMELPSGRKLAFSILVNNHALKYSGAVKVLDAVAEEIYDTLGGVRRHPSTRARRRTRKP